MHCNSHLQKGIYKIIRIFTFFTGWNKYFIYPFTTGEFNHIFTVRHNGNPTDCFSSQIWIQRNGSYFGIAQMFLRNCLKCFFQNCFRWQDQKWFSVGIKFSFPKSPLPDQSGCIGYCNIQWNHNIIGNPWINSSHLYSKQIERCHQLNQYHMFACGNQFLKVTSLQNIFERIRYDFHKEIDKQKCNCKNPVLIIHIWIICPKPDYIRDNKCQLHT